MRISNVRVDIALYVAKRLIRSKMKDLVDRQAVIQRIESAAGQFLRVELWTVRSDRPELEVRLRVPRGARHFVQHVLDLTIEVHVWVLANTVSGASDILKERSVGPRRRRAGVIARVKAGQAGDACRLLGAVEHKHER